MTSASAMPSAHTFPRLAMPAFIEKNYIGRAAGKTTPMGCAPGGSSTLIQINEPLAEHMHDDSDEFIYVIAGQGVARLSGREETLGAAVFLMIPRGMPHTISAGSNNPLVLMSLRTAGGCRCARLVGARSMHDSTAWRRRSTLSYGSATWERCSYTSSSASSP